ncbi:MAG: Tyrosine recombinase XerD [Chlamydiae bacterium]|nr:Tyrosine recombinase XerD [Chlamydiota bacterium]
MTRAFEEATKDFFHYLETIKNASVHTLRNYGNDLKSFKNFITQEKIQITALDEINKRVIREFLAHLNFEKAAKRTLLRRLACLRSFFKYCKREQKITHNPMEEIDTPKLEKTLPQSLSYEQVERLLSQPDTNTYLGFRDRCIMELLYSSGLRISELANLSRKDFDKPINACVYLGKEKKSESCRSLPQLASGSTIISITLREKQMANSTGLK